MSANIQVMGGGVGPTGSLALRKISGGVQHAPAPLRETLGDLWDWVLRWGTPNKADAPEANAWRLRNLPHLWRGFRRVAMARALHLPHFYGVVQLAVMRPQVGGPDEVARLREKWLPERQELNFYQWLRAHGYAVQETNLGLASLRVVTTAGVNFLVDAFQNTTELEILKYHALGTGNTAEAAGDTALVTELTTEYTGNVRATGTTTEGASANIYRSVGTNTLDSGTPAVVEHGLMSQAATGGGTLWDRSVFSAVNLNGANGDGLQTTYDATFAAGS